MHTDEFFEAVVAGDTANVRVALKAAPELARARTRPEQTSEGDHAYTALHLAAHHGHEEIARALAEAGADLDDGSLFYATSTNALAVGRVLLEAGADAGLTGQDGSTALHVAAALRHADDSREFIELLLEFGADINAQMSRGLTPLDLVLRVHEGYKMEQRNRRIEQKSPLPPRNYEGVIELLRAKGGHELSGPQDI